MELWFGIERLKVRVRLRLRLRLRAKAELPPPKAARWLCTRALKRFRGIYQFSCY
jgi:hypothetical protein